MTLNVHEFAGAFKHGGARVNLFSAEFANPVDGSADNTIQFHCKASQIPASTLTQHELGYMGRKLKYAGFRTFENWTCSIYNDEDFAIRDKLEAWNNYINAYQQNIRKFSTGDPTEYKSTGKLFQHAKTGEVLRTYQFFGVWPQDIAGISVDWDTDDLQQFDVTFSYDYFEVVESITGIAGGN